MKVIGVKGEHPDFSYGSIRNLEAAINSWLALNQDKTIIDIKMATMDNCYDALILFEEKKRKIHIKNSINVDTKYSLHDLRNMYARFLVETGAKYKNDCIPELMPKEFIMWMEELLAGGIK